MQFLLWFNGHMPKICSKLDTHCCLVSVEDFLSRIFLYQQTLSGLATKRSENFFYIWAWVAPFFILRPCRVNFFTVCLVSEYACDLHIFERNLTNFWNFMLNAECAPKIFPILSVCLKKFKLVLRMFIIYFAYNEHNVHVKIVGISCQIIYWLIDWPTEGLTSAWSTPLWAARACTGCL